MQTTALSQEFAFVFLLILNYSGANWTDFVCIDSGWNSVLCTETSREFYTIQDFKIITI